MLMNESRWLAESFEIRQYFSQYLNIINRTGTMKYLEKLTMYNRN